MLTIMNVVAKVGACLGALSRGNTGQQHACIASLCAPLPGSISSTAENSRDQQPVAQPSRRLSKTTAGGRKENMPPQGISPAPPPKAVGASKGRAPAAHSGANAASAKPPNPDDRPLPKQKPAPKAGPPKQKKAEPAAGAMIYPPALDLVNNEGPTGIAIVHLPHLCCALQLPNHTTPHHTTVGPHHHLLPLSTYYH